MSVMIGGTNPSAVLQLVMKLERPYPQIFNNCDLNEDGARGGLVGVDGVSGSDGREGCNLDTRAGVADNYDCLVEVCQTVLLPMRV